MIKNAENMECVRCGGTVAPDGVCWHCGAVQPDFRAHVEITAGDDAAGISDRGRRREVNADALALATSGGWTIGVVCDGVSMSPRPERAARVAAEAGAAVLVARLPEGALPEVALHEAAVRAGRAVSALAASKDAAPACTFVAGVAGPEGVWSAWVGDSRAYWLPDEGPGMALTEDDTGDHDALTAWLGADAGPVTARVRGYRPLVPGRLLLCTDGLWRHLPDAARLRDVLGSRRPDARADARTLVGHALDAGGQDNVTAAVIRVVPSPPSR
ncbi:PP2C family protein-serine/threonine phosphatase [Streptomyces yaanensis]|uniref:PP2C family protein-serine/threonine phosphatase n=1 Tax=Streptomyces yaanensis TaxID=1142239 RepID=A0ABV7S859_9ACTN|nr:protein phosphatase 2C domain-containing protein [Streptomyces sp. CGMCC 4.7035]WNB99872.1 protein phosphatase 2C domain-containing protein [Streptomyces sp. CGMCC 4.7035]